jgi:hypothetical protein
MRPTAAHPHQRFARDPSVLKTLRSMPIAPDRSASKEVHQVEQYPASLCIKGPDSNPS